MRKESSINTSIIRFLKSTTGGFVSGQMISRELGISRNAVWKHIEELRGSGYPIEARSRKGYALKDTVRRPYNDIEITAALGTEFIGRELKFLDKTDSTNSTAREMAAKGAKEGTVVVADAQSSGKGRLGRRWHSPKGVNLYTSVILRPPLPPHKAHSLTLVTAVAASEAIENETGLKTNVKWPNDILYGGKKVAGILSEMSSEADSIRYIVIGIGINANMDLSKTENEISGIAASIRDITGREVDRTVLLTGLYLSLEKWYKVLLSKGVLPVAEEWLKRFEKKGKRVTVKGYNDVTGVCAGIDMDGALLIETAPGKIVRVMAGDLE